MRKTILLVAMPGSIHTVRWTKQLNNQDLEIHLFPSTQGAIHPEMEGIIFHYPLFSWVRKIGKAKPREAAPSIFTRVADSLLLRVIERFMPDLRVKQLLKVIRRIRPDLVHSMEMQAAGYLTLEAKNRSSKAFPPWLITVWGSDIFLFGRLAEHREKIRMVLTNCDYFSCECERDVALARTFGFKGEISSFGLPVTGGFNLAELEVLKGACPTADRKVIMLKGYQGWAGRALFGLRALERCAELLSGYEIIIYSAVPDVVLAAELFSDKVCVPVRVLSHNTSHSEILACHARARISIGLSISDGIPSSLLEAMVMGSFPIQSCTACTEGLIEHGVSGMIVPPEDPDIIEMSIRTALSDDVLVNEAAGINWRTAQERLNADFLKQKANDMYLKILQIQR